MSNARHASLVAQLYAACGGVPDIVAAQACRLDKTRLYEFKEPKAGAYMPADVIADLEAYCGDPIYSRAMLEHRPAAVHAKALLTETMETAEVSVALMSVVRKATEDGDVDPAERRAIDKLLVALEEQVRETRAANEGPLP